MQARHSTPLTLTLTLAPTLAPTLTLTPTPTPNPNPNPYPGAPLDAIDQHGNSALHAAGRCGRAAAYELLLQRGGDAELHNERGRPAKLLEGGADNCALM